jgi:hypothetical protein
MAFLSLFSAPDSSDGLRELPFSTQDYGSPDIEGGIKAMRVLRLHLPARLEVYYFAQLFFFLSSVTEPSFPS